MADFKKLSDVTSISTVNDNVNVLIEDNGVIKKTSKSKIGAQADWTETNPSSPAFIKNKPVEEWDIDVVATYNYDDDNENSIWEYEVVRKISSYQTIMDKINNGIAPKVHIVIKDLYDSEFQVCYMNNYYLYSDPEYIEFYGYTYDYYPYIYLYPDDTVEFEFS